VSPNLGPVSIESHCDEAVSALGVIDEVRRGEAEGVDGYVIACFGDPGLLAAREVARGPVVGIAEAAMHAASLIATGFSIVTSLGRTRVISERLVVAYSMERTCRRVRATELEVLDLEVEENRASVRDCILQECRRALDEDGAEAIVLGCAGMADLAADLTKALEVPVIDGVGAGVKLVEMLVGLGLRTSKRGALAFPPRKPYVGEVRRFGRA
jgi:allantoin racemase